MLTGVLNQIVLKNTYMIRQQLCIYSCSRLKAISIVITLLHKHLDGQCLKSDTQDSEYIIS